MIKQRKMPRTRKELEYRLAEEYQAGAIASARSTEQRMLDALKERERKIKNEEDMVLRDSMRALLDMGKAQAIIAEALAKTIHARLGRHFVE